MYNHLDTIGNMFFKKSQTKIVKEQMTAESIGFPYRAKGWGYYREWAHLGSLTQQA